MQILIPQFILPTAKLFFPLLIVIIIIIILIVDVGTSKFEYGNSLEVFGRSHHTMASVCMCLIVPL